jgi:hypothetical protein
METVICAAVRTDTGGIIMGRRHSDCLQWISEHGFMRSIVQEGQGFITTTGRYVDRKEARRIQDAAGIPSVCGYHGNELFSEDLY